MQRPKLAKAITATALTWEELVLDYTELTTVVRSVQIAPAIIADPADDQVLECAVAANADWIVLRDKHLHSLGGHYHGIKIYRPAQAILLLDAL